MSRVIFIIAILVATQCWAEQFVTSLSDFRLHVNSHIRRVQVIGEAIYKMFPGDFPDVSVETVRAFLARHDEAKESLMEELYSFYGVKFDDLATMKKETLRALVTELNSRDTDVAVEFYRAHRILPEAARQLEQIERIADLVDRGQSPVSREEFGRPMVPASRFLNDYRERVFAAYFEQRHVYERMVRQATYEYYKGSCVQLMIILNTLKDSH